MFISAKTKISHFSEKQHAPAIPGLWSIEREEKDEEEHVARRCECLANQTRSTPTSTYGCWGVVGAEVEGTAEQDGGRRGKMEEKTTTQFL